MKNRILTKILLGFSTTILLASSVFAHAPEKHLSNGVCDPVNLELRNEKCDPDNPLSVDLSNGITHEDFPNGLCFPSFNNYTDSFEVDDNGDPTGLGLAPYRFQPPIFTDERLFLKVIKWQDLAEVRENYLDGNRYSTVETIQEGDKLTFVMYIHNDGDPCFNDYFGADGNQEDNSLEGNAPNIPEGRFYSDWKTTSRNTKVSITGSNDQGFENDGQGNYVLDLNNPNVLRSTLVMANIQSDNAVNSSGVVGGKETAFNQIRKNDQNQELYLQYTPDTATYIDFTEQNRDEPTEHIIEDVEGLFSPEGFELSTLVGDDIKADGGSQFASEPYVGMIMFTVDVKRQEEGICTNLVFLKGEETKVIEGQEATQLVVDPNFTDEDTRETGYLKFETDDPNGKFYQRSVFNGQEVFRELSSEIEVPGALNTISVENGGLSAINPANDDQPYRDFFYVGGGNIRVVVAEAIMDPNNVFPIAVLQEEDCENSMSFKEEPMICENITLAVVNQFQTADGQNVRVFRPNVEFSDGSRMPEGSELFWTTGVGGPLLFENEVEFQEFINNPSNAVFGTSLRVSSANKVFMLGDSVEPNTLRVELLQGTSSLEASQIGPNCNAEFVIVPEPETQTCESLVVNHYSEIKEGTLSKFVAKSLDADNEVFNGKITYTVEAGHGAFFVTDDAMDLTNNSTYLEEFDETEVVEFPVNGFCAIPVPDESDLDTINANDETADEVDRIDTAGEFPDLTDRRFNSVDSEFPDLPDRRIDTAGELIDFVDLNAEFPVVNSSILESASILERIQEAGLVGQTTITVDPGTPVYFYANSAGENVITVDTECTTDKACTRTFDVLPGDALVCTEIKESVVNLDTGNRATELTRGQIYQINASLDYQPELDNPDVNYQISPESGAFMRPPVNLHEIRPEMRVALPNLPADLVNSGYFDFNELQALNAINKNYTKSNLEQIFGRVNGGKLRTNLDTKENKTVFLFTYSDGDTTNARLTMRAEKFATDDCAAEYQFAEEVGLCVDLSLEPLGGSFDPSEDFTVFNITGNFKDHPGAIEVTLEGKGSISQADLDKYSKRVTFDQADVTNSDNVLQVSYKKDSSYDEDKDTVTIRVKALGAPEGACEDQITKRPEGSLECVDLEIVRPDEWNYDEDDDELEFRIKVETNPKNLEAELYYHWEVRGEDDAEWEANNDDELEERGKLRQVLENLDDEDANDLEVNVYAALEKDGREIAACSDTIRPEEEGTEEGEFEKFVYTGDDPDDRERTINISSATDGVTYLLVYENGAGNKSMAIEDNSLDNGEIDGSQGGSLDFQGMVIYLQEDGDDEGVTLYQSDDYDEDRSDEEYGDDNYRNTGERTSYYEERYSCTLEDSDDEDDEKENDEFCLDYEDFDDIEEDFQNGDPIQFKNLDKLDEKDRVIIKYQMEVNSAIDEDSCEDLSPSEGCGEHFDNEAEVRVYEDDDYDDLDFELSDDASVIVLCPFIITRSGGDVFFADEIEAGIDIGQCSPVDNTEEVVITPITIERIITSTGGTEGPVAKLETSGTGSTCVLSNFQGEEGDVVSNFSSSVCELNAEINQTWTEENINQQIENNFVRLTRWGRNLGENRDVSFTKTADFATVENRESGVFVLEGGDITVGANGQNIVEINGDPINNIPAALTLISVDGNINIKSNVVYGSPENRRDPDSIPSLALIAINGDIVIDNEVERIDAALLAADLYDNGNGKITNGDVNDKTDVPLLVNGSMFGDVNELFKTRVGVFDPTKRQGSIVINWNLALVTNPSPILTQLFSNVEQVFSQ